MIPLRFAVPKLGRRLFSWSTAACGLLLLTSTAPVAAQDTIADLKRLSLDDLLQIEVSTVSRRDERWWTVPSGIDVVTGEDIRRAGVLNIPDALRLASGVHVGQPNARSWAVSVRGMNVLAANKIAVMMDGRSLFTPFFSGVQWDAQDTLLEDIDRIEVVRGPVGALWGAYAVNGLIQILTKPAWDTQGWLASVGTGTEDPFFLSFRYGGKLGEQTYYRVYAKYSQIDWTYGANGQRTQPSTDYFQTGFRLDATRTDDQTFTLQGDYYTNRDLPRDRLQIEVTGANLLGRWRRESPEDWAIEGQAYLDYTYRLLPTQFEEKRLTYAGAAKYQRMTSRHNLLAGVDALVSRDEIGNFGFAKLVPGRRTTHTLGVFVQDTVALAPTQALTVAAKLEHNSFSGFEFQPSLRHAWTPNERTTLWGAVSRAVRTPVRVDEDLVIEFGGTTLFEANSDFKTEHAIAYELGWRRRLVEALTVDVSLFHYDYEDLRSTEVIGAGPWPQTFGNRLNAESDGAELTLMYQPTSRIFIKGSYRYLDLDFSRDANSTDTSNGSSEGNDPRHLAVLNLRVDLPRGFEFDAFLRHASALPNPALPGYTVADFRLGWRPSPRWELSLIARNLFDRQFPEFITTNSLNEEVRRRATLKVTWRH